MKRATSVSRTLVGLVRSHPLSANKDGFLLHLKCLLAKEEFEGVELGQRGWT